ncbi:MAG: sulfatase-like hydrolase/transferase [Vicinamibacterales bacterium]
MSHARPLLQSLAAVVALGVLNASLTFYNIWPTLKVEWFGHVSVELAVAVLVLAGATLVARRTSARWMLRTLAVVWMALVVGRYLDVVAPALYGRPVNLFWDLRHVSAVAAMMTDAIAGPLVLAGVVAVAVLLGLVYLAARLAFSAVAGAMAVRGVRAVAAAAAVVVMGVAVAQARGVTGLPVHVAPTVSATYWQQARLVATQLNARPVTTASPAVTADLGAVRGADVLLVFVESYGAVTLDRPAVALPLAAARARFDADVAATGRRVVSAMVDSPTFGGSSWLAHVSLMTGVEARDEATNIALMAERRDTIVSAFAQAGYRTVALMPGLRHAWPEGAFYGFDRIYDTAALGYAGPRFGWWTVPDQFALARLDQLEPARAGDRPLFLFFPTTSTHAPFGPTAPYQPDWPRVVSATPYDEPALGQALARVPDYFDLAPSYVNAVSYALATLGGYLRQHQRRDLVLVVVGDHQPAAAVAGEGASWDVPVHVVTSRTAVVDALVARGFHPGTTPVRQALGPMHALLPTLLAAFGDVPLAARR